MKVALVAGSLAFALTIAGCGGSPRPSVQPDLAGKPTWGGCRNFVGQNMDYGPDAVGAKTVAAALATYRKDGDHVVIEPHRDHRPRRWLVVGEDNVIRAAVQMFRGDQGWLASSVEKCAD
jgi:hypothetical protein